MKPTVPIYLVDQNPAMCRAWAEEFEGCLDVKIHCGDFFDYKTDVLVSPANSFGFMDGGLDYAITKRVGKHVQERLQNIIRHSENGELLVGQTLLIPTDNEQEFKHVMSAPTMRVPMILPPDTVNVYLAAKAIFTTFYLNYTYGKKFVDSCNSITISGLGTGVGRVPFSTCAKQMRAGYEYGWMGRRHFPLSWKQSQDEHQQFYSKDKKDLQH